MSCLLQRCLSGRHASTSCCAAVRFQSVATPSCGASPLRSNNALVRGRTSKFRLAVLRAISSQSDVEEHFEHAANNACCYGCGITLQTDDSESAGYVPLDKFQLKYKHGQLEQLFCSRCHALSHGAMIPAVQDFSQRDQAALQLNGKKLISPDELREQLRGLGLKRVLVVLLVDVLDASGSLLSKVRELVGRNPIVLLGTKADLLPAGTRPSTVVEWLTSTAAHKRINTIAVHLISSKTGDGLSAAVADVRVQRKGRDVYVLGAANVGKSAFVRALIREMTSYTSAQYDPAAAAASKRLPVESAMPGTTLSIIPLRTFASGGTLYDTPGLHLHHRLPHLLSPDELKSIHPRRRLKPYIAPPPKSVGDELHAAKQRRQPAVVDMESAENLSLEDIFAEDWRGPSSHSVSATYLWGALSRVDVLSCPRSTHLVFYGPPCVLVEASALVQSEAEAAGVDGQLFGASSVDNRGGLRVAKEVTLDAMGARGAIADIALSGFPGWMAVYAPNDFGPIQLRIWAPKGVEVFVRPPLPVPSPL